jgi:hypothetical protein
MRGRFGLSIVWHKKKWLPDAGVAAVCGWKTKDTLKAAFQRADVETIS